MKIKLDTLEKAKVIIPKINFNSNTIRLFFPLDLAVEHTNEFGIKTKAYTAETHYGSSLLSGLSYESLDNLGTIHNDSVSYASTVDLFSFNLEEFMKVIEQTNLTDEEKDFICGLECCVVLKTKVFEVF